MLPSGFAFTDPISIATAIFVAVLVGLSKGGLGGAMAILGVALLSLITSPLQATGILLPILLVMDAIAMWAWWRRWDLGMVLMMLPGGVLGVAIGWLTAALVSDAAVRLIIGGIAMVYLLLYVRGLRAVDVQPRAQNPRAARFWSVLSGYGSFVAHAGGPAYQIYAMPLRMQPALYTGTSTFFFTIINVVKMVPYTALGQFDTVNLVTSAVLMPVAAVATLAGAALVRRVSAQVFYPFMHLMLALITAKLIWDGLTGL
jgi:uncharacterized membrane protein YfcA